LGKDPITKTKIKFPKKIYTESELHIANDLINQGFKHRLHVSGSQTFKTKVKKALKLVKEAGYYSFLRTYIRTIREIGGLSQLREAEAVIWANIYAVEEPVDASCFLVQKAWQMKNYIEGTDGYGPQIQILAERERSRFLKELSERSKDPSVKEKCEKRLLIQKDSVFF
jgi:hypothetical protein